MTDKTCPYGADDCPKIESMKEILKANSKEIYEIKKQVTSLESTIKTVGFIAGIIAAGIAALIGIVMIR